MTKSAEDVEREVETSRENLDRTVEALKSKMTPGQLFDEATHAMGGAGQQVFSKFLDQAKENPMPLAVMGLGLAWLMSTSNKGGSRPSTYEERAFAPAPGRGIGDKVHAVGDKASDLISGAREKLSGATASAGEFGHTAADRAMHYGQQAKRSFAEVLEKEPLLLGAAGLLVGAAIGAALPPTEAEDRTIGPMRDKMFDKGKDLAQSGMQQAGDVAQAAYSSVKSELQQSADDGGAAADRAEGAVRAGAQAVREQLGDGARR
jgi:hypothetical protein